MNASDQELSLNKLIILYMTNIIDTPLTNSKISEFILNHNYTNYFSLQEFLNQMTTSGLLLTKTISNITQYSITDQGKQTLEFFENRIPNQTKEDVRKYLEDNKLEIRSTLEVFADYIPGTEGDFIVRCVASENKELIIDISLTVYDKDYAVLICENWKQNNHEIYKALLAELTKS